MKLPLFLLAVLQLIAALPRIPNQERHRADGLTISTESGQIHGKIDPSLPNVRQFLGIPYAVPPLGDLRFALPQKLYQPDAQIEATEIPPSCVQYQSVHKNHFGNYAVLQFFPAGENKTGPWTEDCLTLSIWASVQEPDDNYDSQHGVPVIIFSYGGGYQLGGENVPYQIPAQWVNRTPNHIVLSFNYRLNIFGFPNARGLEQNNVLMFDHRAVVEWVRDNIAAFGGDPKRITFWGQSAGAAAIDAYTFIWYEDPIITGTMLDSGTAVGQFPTPDNKAQVNFTFVADHVGCEGLEDQPAKQLACMRTVSADTINNFLQHYNDFAPNPSLSFRPVIDEKVIFSNYTKQTEEGKQAKVPTIMGSNRNEGRAFAPFDPNGVNKTVALYLSLSNIFCFATVASKIRQEFDTLTFRYQYAGNFTNISPLGWLGAYHSSELPLIMGTHPDFRGPSTPLEYATSHAFQDADLAFARDPVNGLATVNWKPYKHLGDHSVREIGYGVPLQDMSLTHEESLCDGVNPVFDVTECSLEHPRCPP
jgi:carboxylesterase type B